MRFRQTRSPGSWQTKGLDMADHSPPGDPDDDRFSPWQIRAKQHNQARRAVADDLANAMTRARQVLADEDDCKVQTRVRYERETARVLAALQAELAAEGGAIRLVVDLPGRTPVDLLAAPEDEIEDYTTPRASRVHDLDSIWRRHGNRRS